MPRLRYVTAEGREDREVRIPQARLCTPGNLQQAFSLSRAPVLLLSSEDQTALFWEEETNSWSEELKDECVYLVREVRETVETAPAKEERKEPVSAEDLMHAVLCSSAAYETDEKAARKFLDGNVSSHAIESVSLTCCGPLRYLVALTSPSLVAGGHQREEHRGAVREGKESAGDKSCQSARSIVVAFRGSDNADDVKTDANLFGKSEFDGLVHEGFMRKASMLPLQPFIDALKPFDVRPSLHGVERILFTGHSMGGSVAQLVYLRFVKECLLLHPDVDLERVSCVSFGSPLIANRQLLSSDYFARHQMKIVNVVDVRDVAALLVHSKMSVRGVMQQLQGEKPMMVWSSAKKLLRFGGMYGEVLRVTLDVGGVALDSFVENVLKKFFPLGTFAFLGTPQEEGGVRWMTDGEEVMKCIAAAADLDINHHRIENYWEKVRLMWNDWVEEGACQTCQTTVAKENADSAVAKRARKVKTAVLFPLDPKSLEVSVAMHDDGSTCRITIKGSDLDFFVLEEFRAQGLPIARLKSGKSWEEDRLDVRLDDPISRQMVELVCKVDKNLHLEHHPVVVVKTSFCSARFVVGRGQIKQMRSLTVAEMAVNTTAFPLFMKAWQRGMAELLASPLALRTSLLSSKGLLVDLFALEKLVVGEASAELHEVARRHISAKLQDLDLICRSKAVTKVLKTMEEYFHRQVPSSSLASSPH